jgi:hypothetical protein
MEIEEMKRRLAAMEADMLARSAQERAKVLRELVDTVTALECMMAGTGAQLDRVDASLDRIDNRIDGIKYALSAWRTELPAQIRAAVREMLSEHRG